MRKLVLQSALLVVCGATSAFGEILTLSDGKTKEGKVSLDQSGSLRLVEVSEYGEVSTTYSPEQIAGIAFELPAGLQSSIANPQQAGLDDLENTWQVIGPFLEFDPEQIAPVGAAYAQKLLEQGSDEGAATAILTKLRALPDPPDDLAAKILLIDVEAAIKKGDIETAQGMIDSATKADAALFEDMNRAAGGLKLVNADLARKKYEELVEEWPKWELMPEIIEERRRLIDAALDGYLFPVAFNPEPAAVTARGLAKAGSLLAATGNIDAARLRYQDIVDNFPVEPYSTEAGTFLAAHPVKDE